MKSPITTHVLDTSQGKPASGILVVLEFQEKSGVWKDIGRSVTDADGRVSNFLDADRKLKAGSYRLTFDTGSYFSSHGITTIFLTVIVPFKINKPSEHYHIPLLLSPFGYSTYRGS